MSRERNEHFTDKLIGKRYGCGKPIFTMKLNKQVREDTSTVSMLIYHDDMLIGKFYCFDCFNELESEGEG